MLCDNQWRYFAIQPGVHIFNVYIDDKFFRKRPLASRYKGLTVAMWRKWPLRKPLGGTTLRTVTVLISSSERTGQWTKPNYQLVEKFGSQINLEESLIGAGVYDNWMGKETLNILKPS